MKDTMAEGSPPLIAAGTTRSDGIDAAPRSPSEIVPTESVTPPTWRGKLKTAKVQLTKTLHQHPKLHIFLKLKLLLQIIC